MVSQARRAFFPKRGYNRPKMAEPMSATRRYPRLPISRLVSFQEQAFDDLVDPRAWMARTADLSEGGVRLETDRALEAGDRLVLDIAVGDEIV